MNVLVRMGGILSISRVIVRLNMLILMNVVMIVIRLSLGMVCLVLLIVIVNFLLELWWLN